MFSKSCLLSCLVWLCCLGSFARAQTTYDIQATYQPENSQLKSEARITFKNDSTEALKTLYFRFSARERLQITINEVTNEEGLVLPARNYRYKYLEKEVESPVLYEVTLPQPLASEQVKTLTVRYLITSIPQAASGHAYLIDDSNEQGTGSWYPRLVHRVDGEWKEHDFPVATYQITLVSSDKASVIGSIPPLQITKTEQAKRTYRFVGERMRGFDLVFSPSLLLRSQEIDGVKISYYYPPALQKWGPGVIEAAGRILRFYKDRYGNYPADRLTIVTGEEGRDDSLASNQLIVLHEGFASRKEPELATHLLNEALAYGIAQQYWGIRFQEEGAYYRWLSQGFSFYLASLYMQSQKAKFRLGEKALARYQSVAREGWPNDLKSPKSVFRRLPFDPFKVLAQGKGYTVVRMMDFLLGKPVLAEVEKLLQKRYAYQIMAPNALPLIVQRVSGKELGWFFKQWLDESWYLDYGVRSLEVKKLDKTYQASLTVQRFGQIVMPVAIVLTLKNGEHVLRLWNGEKTSERLVFEVSDDVTEVKLDPAAILPDIDRSNNTASQLK